MRRDPEPRNGIGDRTHGLEGMETRRGAGPRSPPGLGRAAAATCRARKSAAHGAWRPGRAAPDPPWPTHHAHDARYHLRLRQEAPQVEGAARVGRAVGPALHVAVAAEPRMAENQPDLPAPFWPLGACPAAEGGRGQPPGTRCRVSLSACCAVPGGRTLELRLRWRQGGAEGRKSSPLGGLNQKDQRTPWKRNPWWPATTLHLHLASGPL